MSNRELPFEDFDVAADALGDSPFTVISTHMLRRRLCKAYIAGQLPHFDALLIHHKNDPREPTSFGDDAEALWQLLQNTQGWFCIETSQALTPALGELVEHGLSVPVRYLDDVHFTLTQPAPVIENSHVRRLTSDDAPLILESYPIEDSAQLAWRLRNGAMAGAVVDGRLVAIAQTYAMSAQYCDIGVHTLESYRARGYSTVCAALVAGEVQRRGLTPVWSTSTENHASLCVAAKVGFREVGRMTYIIPMRQTNE